MQWFRMGDKKLLERTIEALNDLGAKEFRTLFSWADFESPGGREWFDFFIHEIGRKTDVRILPSLFYTPPHLALLDRNGKQLTSYPPRDIDLYAQFVTKMLDLYGNYFDWVQIWNEPNWKPYWDWDMDPQAQIFCKMAGRAAEIIHSNGKKVALGGLSPYEPEWITLISQNGLLAKIDSVGINFSPSWDNQRKKWYGWNVEMETARAHLRGLVSDVEVWVVEAGYSTVVKNPDETTKEAERKQLAFFEETRKCGADRIYWYSVIDEEEDHLTDNEITGVGPHETAADYFGMIAQGGRKKPLYYHYRELQ